MSEASFGAYLIHLVFINVLSTQLPAYQTLLGLYLPAAITLTAFMSFITAWLLRKIKAFRLIC
ncbi:MAG: hypothetical protein PHH59_06990 [Methylovulum sp.]|uniref:hypothetical protein n=1 Tax=Methylovulum sp. TaxID=1916980 RepID=UPI002620DD68|nr:hypothetical protein [Methylovulum sp.]MDD2723752.1 hypothetical protein [Methylovulum sp.]MDD5125254.1 hypothetical protein [Methylovulum sp.]